jgi:hypothetical protein
LLCFGTWVTIDFKGLLSLDLGYSL